MYDAIGQHPRVSEVYAERLLAQGVIGPDTANEMRYHFNAHLEEQFEAGKNLSAQRSRLVRRALERAAQAGRSRKPRGAMSKPRSRKSCSTALAAR